MWSLGQHVCSTFFMEWEWKRREKYNRQRVSEKGGVGGHQHKQTSKQTEM